VIRSQKNKVKAAALGYAISFLLLVGLITSGILFYAATNKRIEQLYQTKEHILLNNLFSLRYASTITKEGSFIIAHSTGDSSKVTVRKWGAFQAVSVVTWHGFQQVEKSAINAPGSLAPDYALYVPEMRDEIKLCGETRLEDKLFLPEYGLKRGYLSGKDYKGEKLFYGVKEKSERELPKLNKDFSNLNMESFYNNAITKDFLLSDSSYSFHRPTTLYSSREGQVINHAISGNVIIHSFDSLYISNEASLEHVILISPKIRFESGFKGTVQAIAHQAIICEENVRLNYPSVLVLNEIQEPNGSSNHSIQLRENTQVLGGVLLTSQVFNFRYPVRLLAENARIAGIVYNIGETQLIGEMVGSLITQSLFLKYGGGQYRNYFLDATIGRAKLPEEFIIPGWLEDDIPKKSSVLACF
jgi:hypothetical protein